MLLYFQVCSNSAYPQHSGERYRTNCYYYYCFSNLTQKRSEFWEKNDVLVNFIFTVHVFVRLFWRQCRQRSLLLVLESDIKVHSYEHNTIWFRLKVKR